MFYADTIKGFERSEQNNPVSCFENGDRSFLRNITKMEIQNVEQKTRTNPSLSANKKGTFVYQKFLFCLSKPQAWHIIAAQHAVHIIIPFGAVSHHAPACICLRLDDIQCFALMIYRNKLRMIYTPLA